MSLSLRAISGATLACFGVSLGAQIPQDALVVSLPGTSTRVAVTAATAHVSRDSGRSWQALSAPKYALNFRHGTVHDPLAGFFVPAGLEAPASNRLFLVQFHTQLLDEYVDGLARLGAKIHWYAPEEAFLVRVDAARVPELQALPYVRYVGPFHTFFRLEPELLAEMHVTTLGARRYIIALIDQITDAPGLEAAVRDVSGRVEIPAGGGLLVYATLTDEQVLAIAARDEVLFVQRWTAPEHDMDVLRQHAGVDYVQASNTLPNGLAGEGVRGHIHEGVYPAHVEHAAQLPYRNTPIGVFSTASDTHGNATAGQIFARGASAQAKGILPFGQCYYTNYSGLAISRFSMTQQLTAPTGAYHIMMQTASWGGARRLTYDAVSADIDNIMLNFPIWITQSQSNAGGEADPRMSRPQAWAKNVASIGGFNHFNTASPADDCWCPAGPGGAGSTGPASDGRMGPRFSAYYDNIYTTYSATAYGTFGGTSGATPICNGLGGIAIQMHTQGMFGYPAAPTWQDRWQYNPKFTTVKSLLMATTDQLALSSATRYQQGFGFPNVRTLYDERSRLFVIDELDVLRQGQAKTYYVFAPGSREFRAAMTYCDPPAAAPFSSPHRVNSVDLTVTDPDYVVYRGNNAVTTSLTTPTGGVAADLDTEEWVVLSSAPRGIYRIDVSAPALRGDSRLETPGVLDADFGLTVRGCAGLRDTSIGPVLDLQSSAVGDFRVSITGVPAAASYAYGYVLYSLATARPLATGNFLGLELDFLALGVLSYAPVPGSPFGFTSTTNAATFPNATFAFPSSIATVLSGFTFDAVGFFVNGSGSVVAATNVDRQRVM